jgi:hypothetical protein
VILCDKITFHEGKNYRQIVNYVINECPIKGKPEEEELDEAAEAEAQQKQQ